MKYHAELSGSGAHRWIACPGSVALVHKVGRKPSGPAAREGTMAHALAQRILEYAVKTREGERGLRARFRVGTSFTYDDHGETVKAEVPDSDFLDYVMVYASHVLEQARGGALHLEMHVDLSPFVRDNMWGTCDAAIDKADLLIVDDLKFGYVPVSVESDVAPANAQLMYYAAGALHAFGRRHGRVILEIIQPRATEVPDVQSVELPAKAVLDWAENELYVAAHRVDEPGAPLVPGPHCQFCDALGDCPAQARLASEVAGQDFLEAQAMPALPATPEDIARVLRAAPMIDAWLRAVEERAYDLLSAGKKIDGYKLVRKKSNRKWPTDDHQKLLNALRLMGVPAKASDLLTEPELVTPAELERRVGKKHADAINAVATKPDAGNTIARESDRRPSVNAADDFDLEDVL